MILLLMISSMNPRMIVKKAAVSFISQRRVEWNVKWWHVYYMTLVLLHSFAPFYICINIRINIFDLIIFIITIKMAKIGYKISNCDEFDSRLNIIIGIVKKYMSDQAVLLPNWFPHEHIIWQKDIASPFT